MYLMMHSTMPRQNVRRRLAFQNQFKGSRDIVIGHAISPKSHGIAYSITHQPYGLCLPNRPNARRNPHHFLASRFFRFRWQAHLQGVLLPVTMAHPLAVPPGASQQHIVCLTSPPTTCFVSVQYSRIFRRVTILLRPISRVTLHWIGATHRAST